MTLRFSGKVAIVTGGTSGIGRATAELFAAQGAAVIIAGRREELGEEAVEVIRSKGGEALFVRTDVRSADAVELMVRVAMQRYRRLDYAFNNAGIAGENFKNTAEHSEATWDEVIDTNLRGVWLCMKYELRLMQQTGGGSIVNSASVYAHAGSDFGIAPYVASKHGVLGLTRAAAAEFAKHGVRVNAVSPGITRSEMTTPALEAAAEEFNANIRRRVPMARIGEPEEIAAAVLWLCSADASFVTGSALIVDGGFMVL